MISLRSSNKSINLDTPNGLVKIASCNAFGLLCNKVIKKVTVLYRT